MSHELDELAPGIHAAVFARKDAWHRLGITLDHDLSADDVMTAGLLGGWNVRKVPLTATELGDDGVTTIDLPDKFATVRTNPVTRAVEYLGVVGSQYTPVQNEEHADLLQALVDESGACFDTAGSLKDGRETFITMRMPEDVLVGGADPVNLNLVALNSHDGNSAFRFLVSPVRVVCANTQAAAIRGAKSSFSVRHTVNAGRNLQQAREALGLTFKYVEAFQREAEALAARDMSNREFDDFTSQLLGVKDRLHAKGAKRSTLYGMLRLWRDSDTLDGIRGTRWGAYNVVTEWLDHYAAARSRKDADDVRAARAVDATSTVNGVKRNAFDLLATV